MEKKIKLKETLNLAKLNAQCLAIEMEWLNLVISTRLQLYFSQDCPYREIEEIEIPKLEIDSKIYQIYKDFDFSLIERLTFLIALSPHIVPQLLDVFFIKNETYNRGFSEFGGVKGNRHSGFLPTAETAAFIIAGTNIEKRIEVMKVFSQNHFFYKQKILNLENEGSKGEPLLSGSLHITNEYLTYCTSGDAFQPNFSHEFPAQRINTKLEWSDLILEDGVVDDIFEIIQWAKHQKTLMQDWGLSKILKSGYRTLFYGPPGTGKSLTASLMGKTLGMDVYRIDLSKVVSKYIGETEKNLANIFDLAENKDWILFFDEADALFGKRTNTSDAKDRYANQEVAFLLQRIEDFSGVVILATNLKSNLDEAFARRFQSMIYFPMPKPEQRLKLWESMLSFCKLSPDVDMWKISNDYELAGGAILNVVRYCALKAVERKEGHVLQRDILEGIRKEFWKEGKTL